MLRVADVFPPAHRWKKGMLIRLMPNRSFVRFFTETIGSAKSSASPATNTCCLTVSDFLRRFRAFLRTLVSKVSRHRNFLLPGSQHRTLVGLILPKKHRSEFHSTWVFGKAPMVGLLLPL